MINAIQTLKPLTENQNHEIEPELLARIRKALETAGHNATEICEQHVYKTGGSTMTEKNKTITKILETDIANVRKILSQLTNF